MIRKPDARDFRERGAVVAIRDAGTLAVEGARGVREGTGNVLRTALTALFGLGFLLSLAAHLGPAGLLFLLAGGVAFAVLRVKERGRRTEQDRAARWAEPAAPPARAVAAIEPVRLDLSVGAVGRGAAKIAVPAILFFPTSSLLTFMLPFTLGAIVALAVAFLIVARLTGDRTVLRYDAETLTVRGLLGEGTMLWADVGDIVVRKAAFWDVRVLFTSGSRRNLVVLGRVNRLGGPDTLYIPIDLLGLDAAALARLLTRLLALRTAVAAPSPLHRPAPEPESVLAPSRRPIEPALAPTEPAFDPDAIMARYLAEREALIASQRPDLVAPTRPVFGRKNVLRSS